MAVQHSPALPPMRPGLIDPSRQAEYPIFAGKNLLEASNVASNQVLNVRYNWKSKQIPQRQFITNDRASSESYKLVVREGTSEPYKYSGTTDPKTTDTDTAHLALVFDKERSAFVLESISRSLNFNLTSATTKPNIDQLHQLETQTDDTIRDVEGYKHHEEFQEDDEDTADAENPYDYRHFLAEATKDAERGNVTPKPPMTGISSPMIGSHKMREMNQPANPLQSPFMGPSKRRKVESKTTSRGISNTNQPPKTRTSIAVSKDRATQKPTKKTQSLREKPASDAYAQSPQIIVDEASDLTIDMGSPPTKAKVKHRINPDAFANHSGTQSRADTASVSPHGKDSDNDAEGDVEMDDMNDNDDGDVEDLSLPSPRESRTTNNAMSRITQDRAIEDDEEDDGLAAELEAVFDQEDDGENGTVGLGISSSQAPTNMVNDEESEVSEEE